MRIHGLNKTTLLDYPEHVAATVFTGGCNFCCPFCHNGDLVLHADTQPLILEEEVMAFLNKRKGIITGVCITGGEPTLQPDLADFIRKIKEIGLLVKLDTNGYRPEVLKALLEADLLNYVAMDIKNSRESYAKTVGVKELDIGRIEESAALLMGSGIPYEFRTTVVRELHTKADMEAIGQWIAGADAYFLQSFRDSEQVIESGFDAYEREELEDFADLLRKNITRVELRG